jgi:hypothetical protein
VQAEVPYEGGHVRRELAVRGGGHGKGAGLVMAAGAKVADISEIKNVIYKWMKYIKEYNSTGQWREVDNKGLSRTLTSHRVDDITDMEVDKVINTLCGLDKISGDLYENLYSNLGQLTLSMFDSSDFRMVAFSRFGGGSHGSYKPGRDNRRNNLLVKCRKLGPSGVKKYLDIFKSEDDMFFVKFVNEYLSVDVLDEFPVRFFVCDQLDGLLSLLKDMVH